MNYLAADAGGTGLATFFGGWLVILAVFAWLTPIVIAVARENPNRNQVIVIDLLLGWTGIGWIVALVMALQARKRTAT